MLISSMNGTQYQVWMEDEMEEPYHDFVDIVNDIYTNSPYYYEDTAYG